MISGMELRVPIVAAPMGGGASTPDLVRSVGAAGGLGFLAAGYKTAGAVAAQMDDLDGAGPFGVNVFCPDPRGDAVAVDAYARRLRAAGLEPLGEPCWTDDGFEEKLALLQARPPAVASFAFGCPDAAQVAALQAAGSEVWVTVTTPEEAREAVARGADALVAQGVEAGAHRAVWTNGADRELTLLVLLQLLEGIEVPVVATGGLMSGRGIAAARAAGAWAVQLGTAFLLCPEAGTTDAHRAALSGERATRLTRAYTGRPARGIVTPFMDDHDAAAPAAYPEVHHLTAPLRATQAPDTLHLWAGQGYELARGVPAGELVTRLWDEVRRGWPDRRPAARTGSRG